MNQNTKWTKEKCQEEALKYKTRTKFSRRSSRAYEVARKNNWLNEMCSHMIRFGNKMFRCIYVYEFSDNCAYVGLTYNLQKRNINRKLQNNDAVTKHISETKLIPELKQLTKYIPINEACILEIEYIEKYKYNGWQVLNKNKGGNTGTLEKKRTIEMCREEALRYNTRSEFYHKNNKVYTTAQRYGWLDKICQHMEFQIHHWTIDECKKEALKYSSRCEFEKNNKNSYIWAIRHNVLDEICSHMYCMIGTNQYKEKIK